ncbi:MAG: hypothetical protein ABIT05_10325 [Chitinophagaceae bacterium]
MPTVKYFIVTILILTLTLRSTAQTIRKTFSGWWADTWWIFDFYKDATYNRVSSGHYGFTKVKGNYKINKDTIQLLSGFKNTNGTVNEFYLIDRDSFLIDLTLLYEYKVTNESNLISFSSRKRYDILPRPDPNLKFYKSYNEIDTLVRKAINQLQTKDLWYLSDSDHLNIIRLYNTVLGSQDKKFSLNLYNDFKNILNEKNYIHEVRKIYDWTIGIGIGYIISKLQVEIGGSPNWYSIYIPK